MSALGCCVTAASRTQGTLALNSGEADLSPIGQGVSEGLFARSLILEARLAKKVNLVAHAHSTAGESMAKQFGTGKKKTKHVGLRFLCTQELLKVNTKLNCTDILTKYVSIETLNTLRFGVGVITNWVSPAICAAVSSMMLMTPMCSKGPPGMTRFRERMNA